jgi:hypothetical protein
MTEDPPLPFMGVFAQPLEKVYFRIFGKLKDSVM